MSRRRRATGLLAVLALLALLALRAPGEPAARSVELRPPERPGSVAPRRPATHRPASAEEHAPTAPIDPAVEAVTAYAEASGRFVVRCPRPPVHQQALLGASGRCAKEPDAITCASLSAEGAAAVYDREEGEVALHRWWTGPDGTTRCVLAPYETRPLTVRVVDAEGRPIAGAYVASGYDQQRAGNDGVASLSVPTGDAYPVLAWSGHHSADGEVGPEDEEVTVVIHVDPTFSREEAEASLRQEVAAELRAQRDELAAALASADLSDEAIAVLLRFDESLVRELEDLEAEP